MRHPSTAAPPPRPTALPHASNFSRVCVCLVVRSYASGARYEGEWRNNLKEGRGVYYFPKVRGELRWGGGRLGDWAPDPRGGLYAGLGRCVCGMCAVGRECPTGNSSLLQALYAGNRI